MKALWLLSVWIHLLAAAAWIGGMLFFVSVLVPTMRRTGRVAEILAEIGERFRWVAWLALSLLVATGIAALWFRGMLSAERLLDAGFWWSPLGRALALKLLVVGALLGLAAAHDFGIGRAALEAMRRDPEGAETRRLRRAAAWIGRLELALALVAVFLGIVLVRGWPL